MPDIQKYRKALLDRLGELDTRLHRIEAELDEPHSKDWEEQAVEREGEEVLEQLGHHVADAGLEALNGHATALPDGGLRVRRFRISLPVVVEQSEREIRRKREMLGGTDCDLVVQSPHPWKQTLTRVFSEALDEALEIAVKDQPARVVDGAVMAAGGLAIVLVPLEVAWQLGADIRRHSPFPATLLATTTLNYAGYLTHGRFYEQERADWAYEALGMSSTTGYVYTPTAPGEFVTTIVSVLHDLNEDLQNG